MLVPVSGPRWLSRLAAGVAGVAAIGLTATACLPAAPEVAVRPTDGVFRLTGHGWGHGRGMSQYAAFGGALLGVPAATMLASYYPHTTASTLRDAPVRVRLTADEGRDLVIRAATGLTATDAASGRSLTLPAGPSRWRAVISGTGLHLQRFTTAWADVTMGGASSFAGPLRFFLPGSAAGQSLLGVQLPSGATVDYRGSASAAVVSPGALVSVVTTPMESYLRGVVPREMPASWPAAALQVQAVAARTYAARWRATYGATHAWDICDSTACQVFAGTTTHPVAGGAVPQEASASSAAVAATAGQVRSAGGMLIDAEFSSSNGGWTVDGGVPWLDAHADPWDGVAGGSLHTWQATVTASALEQRFPAVGHLLRLRVLSRDGHGEWGGRVRDVVLDGVSATGAHTSVATTGAALAGAFAWPGASTGLRSSWWHVDTAVSG